MTEFGPEFNFEESLSPDLNFSHDLGIDPIFLDREEAAPERSLSWIPLERVRLHPIHFEINWEDNLAGTATHEIHQLRSDSTGFHCLIREVASGEIVAELQTSLRKSGIAIVDGDSEELVPFGEMQSKLADFFGRFGAAPVDTESRSPRNLRPEW
jgi:hypothetical protein